MKPLRLQGHLIKVHANKYNMDLFYFQTIEKKLFKQLTFIIICCVLHIIFRY